MMDSNRDALAQPMLPDVMNDPAFATNRDGNAKGKGKGPEEADTCRICRGEGSREEPLFYPCKCSGSIKFVHQVCLMEWLSHSQKKHCELCKTSFRFTKLYDPQMPSTVPLGVFIRQATVHTLKSFLTWIRWNLVIFVWLGWVPWCMRTVWRGLFWVGDGGWITRQDIERHTTYLEKLAAASSGSLNSTLPLLAEATSSALLSKVSSVVGFVPDFGAGEPTVLWLGKRLIRSLLPSVTITLSNSTTNATSSVWIANRSPSLLSDFAFLKKLTRWNRFNNILIDVLEGQLITLFVVVAFILIFLIREWVVQQQPVINIGAAINVEAAVADARNNVDEQHEADQQQAEHQDDNTVDQNDNEQDQDSEEEQVPEMPLEAETRPQHRAILRPVGQLRRPIAAQQQELAQDHMPVFEAASNTHESGFSAESSSLDDTLPPSLPSAENTAASGSQRPTMPARDVIARASEIQRTLQEQSIVSGQDWPGIDVFMDLWKRASGDPLEVLGLIEADGRTEELGWIVAAMKKLQKTSSDGTGVSDSSPTISNSNNSQDGIPLGQTGEGSNGSWQVIEESPERPTTPPSSQSETLDSIVANSDLDEARSGHFENGNTGQVQDDDFNTAPSRDNPLGELKIPSEHHDDGHTVEGNDDNAPLRSTVDPLDEVDRPRPEPFSSDLEANTTARIAEIPLPQGSSTHNPPPNHDRPHNFAEAVGDWLWGEVPEVDAVPEEPDEDDEHVVQDVADEEPFVPMAQGQLVVRAEDAPENGPQPDPEVVQAAAEAGIDAGDAEAVEDGEDLEGVMELIGMQGPLAGLVQNGMFSAVLISLSVFFGIWIPYIAGKLVLVFLANPLSLLVKMPLKWVATTADMVIDLSIFLAGYCFFLADIAVRLAWTPLGWILPFASEANRNRFIQEAIYKYTQNAAERIARGFVATSTHFSDSDIPVFSILAHESLNNIQNYIWSGVGTVVNTIYKIAEAHSDKALALQSGKDLLWLTSLKLQQLNSSLYVVARRWATDLPSLLKVHSLQIDLEIPRRTTPIDYNLAQWSIRDRIFAVLLGYIFFSIAGAAYLRVRTSIRELQENERSNGLLVDVLHQAGGVMKVILIITIEMLAFPLYCGILLDVALLPLFGGATVLSRIRFMANSPATSLFIHWFVGTCYMFHFALFVSMCRKIMRAGVLYFIRDPDDPAFHPVRDVLERNVYTQLRKIAFSALVYGALVIICLGTVVWGLSSMLTGVFPIHWSSNEPILPFPVDLLIYNFLMPGVLKFFKPSTGLKTIYRWWFRKCAKALRLTHFLFNEREKDEEGHYAWRLTHSQIEPQTQHEGISTNTDVYQERNPRFIRDGRYVRAPASDQVRIPKGESTFVEVDEENNRIDGLPDNDQGLHGRQSKMFSQVYIPPHFRLRIGAFIVLLWLFAATTGVGFTVVPLLFGRRVFAYLAPSHLRMNDIYAFAIGAYLLGGPLYLGIRYRATLVSRFQTNAVLRPSHVAFLITHAFRAALRAIRLFYFYGAFTFFLPSLVALLFEAYLNIPLNTYLTRGHPLHTIHFVTDWTLGVLYIKLAAKVISFYPRSRPAQALRALVNPRNNGSSWLDPDVRLATRAFILPSAVFTAVALVAPLGLGWVINATRFGDAAEASRAIIFRYSYPAVFFLGLAFVSGKMLLNAINAWRTKVRDEVYLIGERLHNFGEKRPLVNRAATRV